MFQNFGIANKESILGYMSLEQRRWAEIEYELETRANHASHPWYNSPCGLISQLVWKVNILTNYFLFDFRCYAMRFFYH